MSPKKDETAVHCCDPAWLRFLSCSVSRNVAHAVSALQSLVCLYFFLADQISCRSYVSSGLSYAVACSFSFLSYYDVKQETMICVKTLSSNVSSMEKFCQFKVNYRHSATLKYTMMDKNKRIRVRNETKTCNLHSQTRWLTIPFKWGDFLFETETRPPTKRRRQNIEWNWRAARTLEQVWFRENLCYLPSCHNFLSNDRERSGNNRGHDWNGASLLYECFTS